MYNGRVPRLLIALVLLAPLTAACGASGDPEVRPAEAATAAAMAGETPPADEPSAAMVAVSAAEASANAAAWSAVDASAAEFAGRLDAATQAIAACETDAAAGGDFTACLGGTFATVADAQERLVAAIDDALAQAGGTCRGALEEMRANAAAMAEDYRGAIGVTDMTGLETTFERLAADATAYASAAMGAGAVCAA